LIELKEERKMKIKNNLWSAEFLKENFAKKVDLREWIVGTAVSLYPDLAAELLLQLLQSKNPEERNVGLHNAQKLSDFEPLAKALKKILKAKEKLSWEAYEILAQYAPDGVGPLLPDSAEGFHPLKEENDIFHYVSLCFNTLPRDEAYDSIVAQYERIREKDFRRDHLLTDIIKTSPADQLSKWFTFADRTRFLKGLHQLVSLEYIYDGLIYRNVEDNSKARDLVYFTKLQQTLTEYATPHKLSEELLGKLVARPRESARIFHEELESLCQERYWDLATWRQKHEDSQTLEKYQREVLLALEVLKYYKTTKDSGEKLIAAYLVFNAAASHCDNTLLDKASDKAACAFELLSANRLNLPDSYIDALVAADPKLYEDKLFVILEEDKRFIAIENVMKVFKQWAILKPQKCFTSVDRLIACLHSEQNDDACEGISLCLAYLGARVVPSIQPILKDSYEENITQEIYLQGALRKLPYQETLELLLERFDDYEYFCEEDAYLLGKFLHPDLLPLLEKTELDRDSAELICRICDLYEISHPLLSEARVIVEEEMERRANFVSPLDRLMQMQLNGKLPSLGGNFLAKEEALSSMTAKQAKKKKDANRAKNKAKKKAKKKQRKK
jgi:hypothetical protein